MPALVLSENDFMTESWGIVKWALTQNDPENWLGENNHFQQAADKLVEVNDASFKKDLDRYKYADRYPEHTMETYRLRCETFLDKLNRLLEAHTFLLADTLTLADIAIFPFIRQFAMVDKAWFDASPYPALQKWLEYMLDTIWFDEAFKKYAAWKPGDESIYL